MQIFHVGYPKSGSTTIQHLLRADGSVNYLGKPWRTRAAEFFVRDTLAFGDLRQLSAMELAKIRAALCTGHPIISDEILSGIGFSQVMGANSLLSILDNIDLLTNGDFVAYVIFRRPEALLRSYYGELVQHGVAMSFDQFCSLVLLRRYRWVFRGLNYAAILRSPLHRDGRLRPVLFEDVFQGDALGDFMSSAFGVTAKYSAETSHSRPSNPDAAVDAAAALYEYNPTTFADLPMGQPALTEYRWIDRLPDDFRELYNDLWKDQRRGVAARQAAARTIIDEQRTLNAGDTRKRPISPIFRLLLTEIAANNEGIEHEFPQYGFARHKYFEVPE